MLQTAYEPDSLAVSLAPVVSLYRAPFALGSPERQFHAPGAYVRDIVGAAAAHLPEDFVARGVVCVGADPVPRAMWAHVRIKAGEVITLHMPLRGGGEGGGGKQVLGVVAALALTVATAGIAGGALAPVLGTTLFASGGLGASALAAGVGIAGSLILGALSPPPAVDQGVEAERRGGGQDRLEPAAVEGNVLEPNAAIPRVVGTRRVFPPLAAEPFIQLDGQDEIVEAVYVLAGPHKLEGFRLGDADVEVPANDATDLEIEAREGLADDDPLQLATRQGRSQEVNVQLSVHKTDPADGSQIDGDADGPLPVWHTVATRDAPDQNWLQFQLDGLFTSNSDVLGTGTQPDEVPIRIPIRVRLRQRGDTTWRNLPEIHYLNATQSPQRLQVRLIWGSEFDDTLPEPPSDTGFVQARLNVPAQNVQPTGGGWTADSYFDADTGGDEIFENGKASSTDIENVLLLSERVDVYLDDASWARSEYEVQVKRGAAFEDSNFDSATYEWNGGSDILDFFGRRQSGAMPLTRDGLLDRLGLVRLVNIWEQPPIAAGGNAVIALRAVNRRVERLSVEASGYVYDLDGANWTDFTTTSNPAAHFRDVLIGGQNFDPLPNALLDEDVLKGWHARCAARGYTCDAIVESERTADVLRILASCGFARPTQSEVWGVAQDFDRSADSPIQIFTPRNSNGFSWRRAFARLPSGFRVNFREAARNYDKRQITVRRPGAPASEARLEQVTFEGLVSEADVIRRAEYDLLQVELRSAFYSLTAPAEAIVCRRGSLVGVQHDVLSRQFGAGRIVDTTVNGGDVEAITLDAPVEVKNEDDLLATSDVLQVSDMLDVGAKTGIAIRRTDGTVTVHEISTATGETDTLDLATPVSDDTHAGGPFDSGAIADIGPGALVSVGQLGREFRRLIVTEITPQQDLTAQLTMVDEAPDLTAGL